MAASKDIKRDVELLFELGTLRHIQRTWVQFSGANVANLAEHHFRVAWLAMSIAAMEGADTGKVAKLALVHDIAESRTGDAHYLSRLYVDRHEDRAIRDTLAGTSVEAEFATLWKEYEERQSLESKIVKDADNLDVQLELREQAAKGEKLEENWNTIRLGVSTSKIYTASAKRLWLAIVNANPHDWHTNGTNRFTAGDWRPEGVVQSTSSADK